MRLIPLFLLPLLPAYVSADESWQDKLQIHGFASQAFVHTSDNNFFGDSDTGSFDFTELGINASYQLLPKIRLSGQVISRRAGKLYNGSPWLDYAFIDFNFISTPTHQFGSYLGRIKNPVGLYNETRDVAHTRQGIFASQALYFDKVRNLVMAADGLHLYSNHFMDNGNLLLQAGAGYPIPDKNVEYTFMGQDWDGKLKGDDLGIFAKIVYEHNGGRWIYSFTTASLTLDFDSGAADRVAFPTGPGLTSGELHIDYSVLSAQYNGEKWQFTTEATIEHVDFDGISPLFESLGGDAVGFYGQVDYKFTPQWQAFLRYEEFHLDKHDWNGSKRARESVATSQFLSGFGIQQAAIPAHNNYIKTVVVGGHWDIKPSLRLRTEYHISEGTATLSPRENNVSTSEKYWNMFAVSLSYRF
mgnify:FL=1